MPQNKSEEVESKGMNPKVLFGSILFFGFLALGVGGFKIWRDLRLSGGPPAQAGQENQFGAVSAPQVTAQFSTNNEELKTKDTDSDGLSDYDELNVYGTSPYLKDSDGDTYTDKVEIDSNNDPNCPKGTECRTGLPAQAGQPAPVGSTPQFNELIPPAQGNETAAPPPDLSKMTPQELRTLLLATGQVTEDQLKQIDDATLMQMYQDTLKEQEQTVQQQPQP
ncbi:MAG: hypothetical protein WC659_04585 [Patescibacteria group bacterium]